jgi:hypothetical protein
MAPGAGLAQRNSAGHTTDGEVGKRLWAEIELRLQARSTLVQKTAGGVNGPRFGQPQTVLTRSGRRPH